MPLLVVPLAPAEAGLLTLREWDALAACRRVLFERPDHPLVARLAAAGVEAGPFDDEPEAGRDDWGLVADPGSARVVELARAGATVTSGPAPTPDALTAAHAAPTLRGATASLGGLVAIMARLRSVDGCPWDLRQTHASLLVHLVEEAYEVVDAVENDRLGVELEEELGDVLLQVAFHARLAELDGRFDAGAVAGAIAAKLVHRHPHVFGDVEVSGADEVLANWESIKTAEKRRPDPFEGIPEALPALLAAAKTLKRAAGHGLGPEEPEARARLAEAVAQRPEALGAALFSLAALAARRGADPEAALRAEIRRFREQARAGSDR